jgi:hypothetical protein
LPPEEELKVTRRERWRHYLKGGRSGHARTTVTHTYVYVKRGAGPGVENQKPRAVWGSSCLGGMSLHSTRPGRVFELTRGHSVLPAVPDPPRSGPTDQRQTRTLYTGVRTHLDRRTSRARTRCYSPGMGDYCRTNACIQELLTPTRAANNGQRPDHE